MRWALVAGVAWVAACGKPAADVKYPERPEGCDVAIFHEAPDVPVDNLGPVQAKCDIDVSESDCLRTLKDQACKLGGDVVWGVADAPRQDLGKNRWSGRAAHTRAPSSDAGAPAR